MVVMRLSKSSAPRSMRNVGALAWRLGCTCGCCGAPVRHLDRTGALRGTHLRGRTNIVERLLVHSRALNLGLPLRRLLGVGTPRALQGRGAAILATCYMFWCDVDKLRVSFDIGDGNLAPSFTPGHRHELPSLAG